MSRLVQRLTTLVVIGLGLFGLTLGLPIARFAALENEGPPTVAINPTLRVVSYDPAQADSLRGWREAPGIREASRSAYLAAISASGQASPQDVEAAARDVLLAAPTSSLHWAILAKARLERDAPLPEILTSIAMSRITGPHEEAALSMRSTLLLRLWERLPASERAIAIDQIITLRAGLDAVRQDELRTIIASLSAATRSELRAMLAARGADAPILEMFRL